MPNTLDYQRALDNAATASTPESRAYWAEVAQLVNAILSTNSEDE
jgi:hypothetical protein